MDPGTTSATCGACSTCCQRAAAAGGPSTNTTERRSIAKRASFGPGQYLLACIAAAGPAAAAEPTAPPLAVTHGVSAGDVDHKSAVIWSRANTDARMQVRAAPRTRSRFGRRRGATAVRAGSDYAGQVQVTRLRPATYYDYEVWFERDGERSPSARGEFRTAPRPRAAAAVSFAWGGDLAGQNACRDADEGFPILATIASSHADFFIGLGDMIYADGICTPTGLYGNRQVAGGFGPAASVDAFWAHWKYNRADGAHQALLRSRGYYAVWDDHEVVDNFGPGRDTRESPPYSAGEPLMPLGLQAFRDFNPLAQLRHDVKRLYRSFRWGRHVELFMLDTRQYRDTQQGMLGPAQLDWLQRELPRSTATWKVIVSSVPVSIPNGAPFGDARDGWGNFEKPNEIFETELLNAILLPAHARGDNLVFITTDVHFASALRYRPFGDAWVFHEFVSGPLNAGLFPTRALDTTLAPERLFFWGPDSADAVTDFQRAKHWFNYGAIEVDASGLLTAQIIATDGKVLHTQTLRPANASR